VTVQPDAAGRSGEQGLGDVGAAAGSRDQGGDAASGRRQQEGGAAGAAQRRAWLAELLPPVERVRPGLWSIPVPWPRSPLRYTLAYLVSSPAGPALIDTGWPTDQAWTALVDGIRQTGHDVTEVRYVLVTHAHADHLGMAGRMREAYGALVGMHRAEAAILRPAGAPAWRPRAAGWLRSRGAPGDQADEILDLMAGAVERHASLARPDVEIEDGSLPLGAGTALRAVWTPGHTPGHLCFHDEQQDVLLTGDHVLPRITPHIALPPGAEGDPLGDYLASLRALARFRPAEVLPAHEHRFTDLGARIATLLRHHRARLAEIEHAVACDPGLSTWAVAEALTWSRGWEQTRGLTRHAAVSETWAHLVHLQARERVINQGRSRDSWLPGPRCSAAD
jgi:glyoxylase-like metal-dependent hydrolase (beta-lactamase superfamily II)